jgi:hypothetical protein
MYLQMLRYARQAKKGCPPEVMVVAGDTTTKNRASFWHSHRNFLYMLHSFGQRPVFRLSARELSTDSREKMWVLHRCRSFDEGSDKENES